MAAGRGGQTPTIRDVAKRAGVSAQTVSRVLNTPQLVRPDTRERVLVCIDELGYRRSPLAWGLATNRSGAIGVIDSGSGVLGQLLLLSSIEVAARADGYSPRIVNTGHESPREMASAFAALTDEMVEGIIILGNTTLQVREAIRISGGLPTVLVANDEIADHKMSTVSADQSGGARAVMHHLLAERKRQRIAMIAGPRGWVDSDSRLKMWRELSGAEGDVLLRHGDWSAESGYAAMNELLDQGIDAVFTGNDYMALGALAACAARGVAVPEDISVVGFDDVPGADYFQPSLTTVRQPFSQIGVEAAHLLGSLLQGEEPRTVVLPTELIVRRSS